MAEIIRLCSRAELPADGCVKEMNAAGRPLCIANIGGDISAIDNVCPHHGGPLGEGSVENGEVICPWHAWAFDPKTGAVNGDANERIAVFPIRIEGEEVFTEIE